MQVVVTAPARPEDLHPGQVRLLSDSCPTSQHSVVTCSPVTTLPSKLCHMLIAADVGSGHGSCLKNQLYCHARQMSLCVCSSFVQLLRPFKILQNLQLHILNRRRELLC